MLEHVVFISEPADQDLIEIKDYITTQYLSPETAVEMVETIYAAMFGLSHMPKRHPLVEDVFLTPFGYRILPVKKYLVFYTINDSSEIWDVNIERILYSGRNWQHILRNDRGVLDA